MSDVKIDFQWSRAYSSRPGRPAYAIEDAKIVQVGDRKEAYSPFRLNDLYLEFAQLDGSPKACLGFAQKYGLLCEPARVSRPPAEDLSFWRSEIKRMSISIRFLPKNIRVVNSRGTIARIGKVDILLVPGEGPDAPPAMVMEPGTLLDAMNLEMANFVSGGGTLIPCRNCGVLFQAGAAARKRTVAQFHNDECRIAFNNAKRRSAK